MSKSVVARLRAFRSRMRELDRREFEIAETNPHLMDALKRHKREGLILAVRARWIALSLVGIFLPFMNPSWDMLYYEALLGLFMFIGWVQTKVGQVGQSRKELALIYCDLILMTITLVVPNPFDGREWPTAMQYRFEGFAYFYILLAGATMSYSWRTILSYGTWVAVLWMSAFGLVLLVGFRVPGLSESIAGAMTGSENIFEFIDPNDPQFSRRFQEILIFAIVAAILAMNGWRTSQLILRQGEIARERANLSRHFPPRIVDQMADQDEPLGAVRSQSVAIMFADIVGFTRFAESHSPEEVVGTLREFHHRLEDAVFSNRGTLDKFLGDGIMATFGTPETRPEDALNALLCAKSMLEAIDQWNGERALSGEPPIRLSIGIHFGEVILGDIGSERHLEFAAIGDTVNVASRLEALTRDLDVRLIVSDELVKEVRAHGGGSAEALLARFATVEQQALRGRSDPLKIWTLRDVF